MNPNTPSTWMHLSDHPSFKKYGFGDNWQQWYEGDDPAVDLSALRECSLLLLKNLPDASVELIILDDLTTFVRVSCGKLVGQFGVGCDIGTLYVMLDPDPSDEAATDEEVDNLSSEEVVEKILVRLR